MKKFLVRKLLPMGAAAIAVVSIIGVGCATTQEQQHVQEQEQQVAQVQEQQVIQEQEQQIIQETEQHAVQEQEQVTDTGGFIGLESAEVDDFSGQQTVFIAAEGDGSSPYSGVLLLSCSSSELQIVLADIPYVTSDTRRGNIAWVTPDRIGNPSVMEGLFFDSAGGDRNWYRSFKWRWTDPDAEFKGDTAIDTQRFLVSLIQHGTVTLRIQTYSKVFTATFDFGDITAAEHWDKLAEC